MTTPDPAEAERAANPPEHALMFSARDQIAKDRRCERWLSCRLSSQIFRDCQCMQAAYRRVMAGEHRKEPRDG